jgi:hypothetical protein
VDFVVCTLAVKTKIRAGFDLSDRTIPLSVTAVITSMQHCFVSVFLRFHSFLVFLCPFLYFYYFPENRFGLAVALETRVLEVTGSTLGRDIGYPE